MSAVRALAAVALGVLALAGCTGTAAEPIARAAPMTAETYVPVEAPAMRDLTDDSQFRAAQERVAAAIEAAEAESAAAEDAEPSNHCGDQAWWDSQQSGDPGTYEVACGEYPPWLENPEAGLELEGLCGDGTGPVDVCGEPFPDEREWMSNAELCEQYGECYDDGPGSPYDDCDIFDGIPDGYAPPEEC